jgi:hypothetical protein
MSVGGVVHELSKFLTLGDLLEEIRRRWGSYELVEHWQQGEFHHDVVVRIPGARAVLGGDVLVIATNCNGGVKEALCFERIPQRSALWHSRCPDNPDFEGTAPAVLTAFRTEHWFDPCELLASNARSEYREEFRERQCGGGWTLRKSDGY